MAYKLKEALLSYKPGPEEAEAFQRTVVKQNAKYQRRAKRAAPTIHDRLREYT